LLAARARSLWKRVAVAVVRATATEGRMMVFLTPDLRCNEWMEAVTTSINSSAMQHHPITANDFEKYSLNAMRWE
jgi:hypothetical protein